MSLPKSPSSSPCSTNSGLGHWSSCCPASWSCPNRAALPVPVSEVSCASGSAAASLHHLLGNLPSCGQASGTGDRADLRLRACEGTNQPCGQIHHNGSTSDPAGTDDHAGADADDHSSQTTSPNLSAAATAPRPRHSHERSPCFQNPRKDSLGFLPYLQCSSSEAKRSPKIDLSLINKSARTVRTENCTVQFEPKRLRTPFLDARKALVALLCSALSFTL